MSGLWHLARGVGGRVSARAVGAASCRQSTGRADGFWSSPRRMCSGSPPCWTGPGDTSADAPAAARSTGRRPCPESRAG